MNGRLIAIASGLIGLILGVFDSDSFTMIVGGVRSGWVYFALNPWYYGDSFYKLYTLLFMALIYLHVVCASPALLRRFPFPGMLVATGLLVTVSAIRLLIDGQGIAVALAGTEMRSFMLIFIVPIIAYFAASSFNNVVYFCAAFLGALLLKAVLLAYGFVIQGGVVFLGSVSSVVVDGSALASFSFGGLCAAAISYTAFIRGRRMHGVIFALIALMSLAVVAGSFRRLALIKAVSTIFIFLLLVSHAQRNLVRRLPVILLSSALVGGIVTTAYLGIFGFESTMDRVMSLTRSSEDTTYSSSNKFYKEDWVILGEILGKTHGLGVGFRNEYGVGARSDMGGDITSANIEIPLHTGLFEMWARQGIFAAIAHVVCFIFLPIYSILVIRRNPGSGQIMTAMGAAWLLFNGLCPFGAPTYTNLNNWFFAALSLGLMACGVAEHSRGLATGHALRITSHKLAMPRPAKI